MLDFMCTQFRTYFMWVSAHSQTPHSICYPVQGHRELELTVYLITSLSQDNRTQWQKNSFTLTYGEFWGFSLANLHMFGLWEETECVPLFKETREQQGVERDDFKSAEHHSSRILSVCSMVEQSIIMWCWSNRRSNKINQDDVEM